MNTKSSINQRFIHAINYLIKTKPYPNKSNLARNLQISKSKFSEILNKRMNVGIDTIGALFLSYNINPIWILSGNEKMVRIKSNSIETKESANIVPFYDGVSVGDTQEASSVNTFSKSIEYVDTGDWFRDATAAMRVYGDSMHPIYKSGSIVALKQVSNKRLVVYGQDYVIETEEYRILKRLQRAGENSYWSCYSSNEEKYSHNNKLVHEPFDILIDSVSRLYKVLGSVDRTDSNLTSF